MSIRGVIFDMDGTLLDTEKLYQRFWVEAANRLGYPMKPEHTLAIRAMASVYAEAILKRLVCPEFDYYAVRALRRELMEAYVDEHGVDPKPGMLEVLRELRGRGLRIGLATATDEPRARKYLRMVGAEEYFDAVTCASMVERGKPEPDIYLRGAAALGFRPEECLALEDSPAGILSAYRARCLPVMVPDQDQPAGDTLSRLYAKADTLADVIALLP